MKLSSFLKGRVEASLLLGGFGLLLFGILLIPSLNPGSKWQALPIISVGLALFLVGVTSIEAELVPPFAGKAIRRLSSALNVYPNQVILLVLSLALAIIASLAAGDDRSMLNPALALAAWSLAIFLVFTGFWRKEEEFPTISRRTLLYVYLLFLVGVVLRGISIEDIPPVLTGDEASMGLSALNFIQGNQDNIFSVGWFSFPNFYYFIQSLFIRLLGPTTAALRIPSALIGGLTVAALYLVARRMFTPLTALLAATYLAGFHFHIHFSRLGLNNIWGGFWFTVVLGMLWDGWYHNRRSSFIIAGAALGFSQYFYVSARFLPAVIFVWVGLQVLFNKPSFKEHGGNLMALFTISLVVALPLFKYFAGHPDQFMAPFVRVQALGDWLQLETANTSDPSWKIVGRLALTNLRVFFDTNLESWYRPNTPLLRTTASGLFTIGLILLLRKWRLGRTQLIILWILAILLPAALSLPAAAAQRYVAVAPAAALLVGFSLGEIVTLLNRLWGDRKWIFSGAAFILILLLAVDDARFYFIDYTPYSQLGGANTLVAQRLADHLKDEGPLEVAFFGLPRMGYYSISSLSYLAPDIAGLDIIYPWGSSDNPELSLDHVYFVFLPNHIDNLNAVQVDFPDGTLMKIRDDNDVLLFWLYDVWR